MFRFEIGFLTAFLSIAAYADQPKWYRSDVPEVLVPPAIDEQPAPSAPSADIGDFKRAYDQASRPGIVIFWQRVMSDEIDSSAYSSSSSRTDLGELRTGFVSHLKQHGVKFVSREFGTRAVAADKMHADNYANGQHLELLAVEKYAGKVLELLLLESSSDRRLDFSLRLIDTKSGVLDIDSQVSVPTLGSLGKQVLVANDSGLNYRRTATTNLSAKQIGEGLAIEFMSLFIES